MSFSFSYLFEKSRQKKNFRGSLFVCFVFVFCGVFLLSKSMNSQAKNKDGSANDHSQGAYATEVRDSPFNAIFLFTSFLLNWFHYNA